MKKTTELLVMTFVLVLLLAACGQSGTEPEEVQVEAANTEEVTFTDESYLVSAQWLSENMDNENLLILDARGEEAHAGGHIEGAIPVAWQAFSLMEGGPGAADWGTVLEADALSEKLSQFGISPDKEIVVYTTSPGGWGEEGRFVWMLRRAGFDNAMMLDGGFDYWAAKDYPVSKEAVELIPVQVTIEAMDDATNITTAELADKLEEVVIIDVREKAEYEGATKYGEARGGHLPGAINIVFNEFLNNDGTLKSATEIQAILYENGVSKEDEIITYCTAGIRSAHMQVVLAMMGYDNVKNYDASFYEWAAKEELALEQ